MSVLQLMTDDIQQLPAIQAFIYGILAEHVEGLTAEQLARKLGKSSDIVLYAADIAVETGHLTVMVGAAVRHPSFVHRARTTVYRLSYEQWIEMVAGCVSVSSRAAV